MDTFQEEMNRERRYQKRNMIFVVIVIVIFLIYSFVTGGNSNSPLVSIEDNTVILYGIDDYTFEIPVSEIQKISCETGMDYGEMTDGTSDGTYCCGIWQNDTLGTYQLYVSTAIDTCIIIETSDEKYVFNSASEELTNDYYEALLALLEE